MTDFISLVYYKLVIIKVYIGLHHFNPGQLITKSFTKSFTFQEFRPVFSICKHVQWHFELMVLIVCSPLPNFL